MSSHPTAKTSDAMVIPNAKRANGLQGLFAGMCAVTRSDTPKTMADTIRMTHAPHVMMVALIFIL